MRYASIYGHTVARALSRAVEARLVDLEEVETAEAVDVGGVFRDAANQSGDVDCCGAQHQSEGASSPAFGSYPSQNSTLPRRLRSSSMARTRAPAGSDGPTLRLSSPRNRELEGPLSRVPAGSSSFVWAFVLMGSPIAR